MEKKHISQIQDTMITKAFGVDVDGKEVDSYSFSNANGLEMEVINYGATITSLKVPLSNGQLVDVVLGFENLTNYIDSFGLPNAPYLGAVVGRYAGRINKAQFPLDGKKITLTQNHNQHQIHGGKDGFSKAFWKVTAANSGENPSLTLAYTSKANEENYPGELKVQVTYTLTEANELKVAFLATASDDTIINLTQHSYFNLDGHNGEIIGQEMFVGASQILETTAENIPTGNFIQLDNHPFNFRVPKACPSTIDNTFVLVKTDSANAILLSRKNNLKMSVFTDQPGIHVYVGGNCFNQIKGKESADYNSLSGICFETQNFPDAPNHSHFPNAILRKGETYTHQTIFKFETLPS